tara:strand:+ start:152212 stop:153051 length:840 start_codon:yes stop_codon:yes gene_type:complete
LKAWEKLEEKLNLLIESMMNFLRIFVAKSTPSSIKNTIDKRKGKPLFDLQNLQVKLLGIKSVFDSFFGKISGAIGKALLFFKTTDFKKIDWEKVFLAVFAVFSPFIGRVRDWYIAMKPTTMLAMVSVATMGGLSSIAIYQQVQKISEKRAPASEMIEEAPSANTPEKRPVYYKRQERELRVRNVSFPVYAGRNPASKLVIDFTFVSSNRYIKEYFFENIHLLKDKLNTSVEQILPNFPLEDDGKRVIKEKIKKEMQVLLNDLKIEGSIEEVHIHSIMAG